MIIIHFVTGETKEIKNTSELRTNGSLAYSTASTCYQVNTAEAKLSIPLANVLYVEEIK